jgi:hypothetical protein
MSLKESITTLSKNTLDRNNDWYSWKKINEKFLESKFGITLPSGNQYTKNIALKKRLHEKWMKADKNEKIQVIKYYISTWGGIHRNSREKIDFYSDSNPKTLIDKGSDGVASWSKALCIYDPKKYAIFDARVSASLNALQVMDVSEIPMLYPACSSRNATIVSANKFIKTHSEKNGCIELDPQKFYMNYLHVITEVSEFLSVNVCTIEMILFSKSEELVKQAFSSEFLKL